MEEQSRRRGGARSAAGHGSVQCRDGPARPPDPRPEDDALKAELERVAGAALEAALEAMAAPVFLVRAPATVLCANRRGMALLAAEPDRVLAALGDAAARGPDAAVRHELREPGHFLAVLPELQEDAARRARGLAPRWGLTPRQTAVLALVAEGDTNRIVAQRLGCSEKTIELHVSALLAKTRCTSRSQLVAAFWTDPSELRRGDGDDGPAPARRAR